MHLFFVSSGLINLILLISLSIFVNLFFYNGIRNDEKYNSK